MISYTKARELNRKGNVVPLFERIAADLDTPVSAYIKLARKKKFSFLLESIEGGEKIARYSFLGFDPFLIVESFEDSVRVTKGKTSTELDVPPIDFVRELFSFYRPIRVEGLPRFTGGGVGFFAYDTVRWVEDIPDKNKSQIDLPDMRLGLYSRIVAFDHLRQEIVVIANILHESGEKGFKK
ncbi:MAG: anthranilate synthase component I, partial [bacterium]|nr:anthranilate synthase component I [bacterium]